MNVSLKRRQPPPPLPQQLLQRQEWKSAVFSHEFSGVS
jgi:hypothetical protein